MKTFLVLALILQASVWTADEHKAAMNDASDLQEDVRDALAANSGVRVAEAAGKIERLMGRTEDYWSARRQADIVKLAQATRALAVQLGGQAKAGKLDQAKDTFAKMNASCNTCHDLHPEKR